MNPRMSVIFKQYKIMNEKNSRETELYFKAMAKPRAVKVLADPDRSVTRQP